MLNSNIDISRIDANSPATVMIHSAHEKLTVGQINYWIKIFIESKVNFSILIRDIVNYKKLINLFPKYSILYAKTPLDVETVVVKQPKLEKVFYMTNMAKNIHLLRFNHLKHIFIGTKNSDQLSKINKSYRAYDEIYVSSQSQIDKFKEAIKNTGHLKFLIVGKPQLKDIFKRPKNSNLKPQLSYFPSWEGKSAESNLSSLNMLPKFLYTIKDFNLSLWIKLHSKTGRRDKTLKYLDDNIDEVATSFALEFKQHRYVTSDDPKEEESNMREAFDMMLKTDIIICDLETLSFELLALNVPIFIYVPKDKNIERFRQRGYFRYAYIFSDIEELKKRLDTVLNRKDELKEKRKEALEYWLGQKETLNNIFVKQLKKYV
jgi:hypothetical protein